MISPLRVKAQRDLVIKALAIPTVLLGLYFAVPFSGNRWPLGTLLGLVATIIVVPITARHVRRIRTSEAPVGEALVAVSMLASMVLVGFSIGYYSLAQNSDQIPGIHTRLDSLYFTATTLSTVGYGDIVATGQFARGMVTAQIVINLTLIAGGLRLVTSAAQEARRTSER